MVDVDLRIIGFICIVVIIVIATATAYTSYKKKTMERREGLYLNEPKPYLPEPKVVYPGHGGGGEDFGDNDNNTEEPCCSGDSDMLTLMIIALLNKAMNKTSKVANADCVQRVVKHTIPQVMLRLGAYGIDMNNIDYGNPSIVNTVNAIIVDIIQEAMRDPDMCADEPYPPAKCPTQIVDVDVPACENCGGGSTTTRTPSGPTTKPPPPGKVTTTLKPPTTTPKGKPATTTKKPATTTKKPATCAPSGTTKAPTCATTTTGPPTCRTTSKAPTTLPLCTSSPKPTGTVAPSIPPGTYFIMSSARNNGKCDKYLTATSCSVIPKVNKPTLTSTESRNAIWILKKLANRKWIIQSNGREGTGCANILSTNACTANADLGFSTASTAMQTWTMEIVPNKQNTVRFKSVGRAAPKCKNYLSAQNCNGTKFAELNDLNVKTLNQEWVLRKATRDRLYEGDCMYSGEFLYSGTSSLTLTDEGDMEVKDHETNKTWSLRKTMQHTRDSLMGKKNGPFRLCMEKTGELVLYNVKNARVWYSDTVGKANGPFRFIVGRDDKKNSVCGIYQSTPNKANLTTGEDLFEIWNSLWTHSCEAARQLYIKNYKIGNTDPWDHYKAAVLNKVGAQKEKRQWLGPKCANCENAKAWYKELYPDVVAAKKNPEEHYFLTGAKEDRIWKGIGGNDVCIGLPKLKGEILLGIGTDFKLYTKANLRDPWVPVKQNNCCLRTVLVTREGWILGIDQHNKLVGKLSLTGPWTADFGDASNITDIFQLTSGEIGGIGKDKKLYKKPSLYAPWQFLGPQGLAIAMDTLKDKKYIGVGADKLLYIRDNPAAGTWAPIKNSGAVIDLVELSTGPIIGIGTDKKLHFIENRNKFPWRKAWVKDNAGSVIRIDTLPSPHKPKPFHNKDILNQGECLKSGQELISADGKHKVKLDANGHFIIYTNGKKAWSAAENGAHTNIPNISYQGPFTICLKADGDLWQQDSKKKYVWNTDTSGKGEAPFYMQIQNDGHLLIRGKNNVAIWAHKWPHNCASARADYLKMYKPVANAKKDPWEHYKATVLNKATGKELRQWRGPKCGTCEEAKKRYNDLYADVVKAKITPALHYRRHGEKENRIWKGISNQKCLNVLHEGWCLQGNEQLVSPNGKYKLSIDQKSGTALIIIQGPEGNIWISNMQHTREAQYKGKGPYTFCMRTSGELVQFNKLNEWIWRTDTESKASRPFRAELTDLGQLVVLGKNAKTGKDLPIWNNTWPHDCQSAKDQYKATHKDIGKKDPWTHYVEKVIKQPDASKEFRIWQGPKCANCVNAKKWYHTIYPDVPKNDGEAFTHYPYSVRTSGKIGGRIWKGQGKPDACVPTTTPKPTTTTKAPTPAPTTKAPTPSPTPVMCIRKAYAIEQISPGEKRFKGKNPGDIPCMFPNDGKDIPKEGEWFKWYS